jgi:hypothetical protein
MISRIKDYLEFHEQKDKHQSDIQFFRSLLAYVEGLEAKAIEVEAAQKRIAELELRLARIKVGHGLGAGLK